MYLRMGTLKKLDADGFTRVRMAGNYKLDRSSLIRQYKHVVIVNMHSYINYTMW